MKKWGIFLVVFLLCMGTVTAFATIGGMGKPAEKDDKDADAALAVRAESFEDIKEALEKSRSNLKTRNAGSDMIFMAVEESVFDGAAKEGAMTGAPEAESPESHNTQSDDFSATNTQIEGIDEADIIKTDGEYIYLAGENGVIIVKPDEEGIEIVSEVELPENCNVRDVFIDENRLVVMGYFYRASEAEEKGEPGIMDDYAEIMPDVSVMESPKVQMYCYPQESFCYVAVYDTADKKSPALLQEFTLEGNLLSARKNGDFVYIVAQKNHYSIMPIEAAEEEDILPLYSDSVLEIAKEDVVTIEPNKVLICPIGESNSFNTLAVLNITEPSEAKLESYLGNAQELYMNDKTMYMTFFDFDSVSGKEQTGIIGFDVSGDQVEYRGSAKVYGHLLNQFSMDEYNGYFRIATTEWGLGSNLFVLDRDMKVTGKIENIAQGEQIYSVRFAGEKGFMVTFETMDPFFTLDLSDPANPRIAGELKMPGFSNYLHPVSENLVLGIGRDTQEIYVKEADGSETVIGFRTGGIKLSLFDVTDFNNPKEVDKYCMGDEALSSDVLYDHKALMTDGWRIGRESGEEATLIGFCTENYGAGEFENEAFLFEVSNNKIEMKKEIMGVGEDDNNYYDDGIGHISRLCYIGDILYYIQNGTIRAFDMSDEDNIFELWSAEI